MKKDPGFADVLAAEARIRGFVKRTPIVTCRTLNELSGADVYLKCENLQRTGSFKLRGAANAVRSLEKSVKSVCTHSSGNFAQALALAARNRGMAAHLVMPKDAPAAKRAAAEEYGGTVHPCERALDSRERECEIVRKKTGAVFIHGYDDPAVIAGQGTAGLELLREVTALDALIAPLGGGGLLSGTALASRGLSPVLKVYGAEPELADDAYTSLKTGKLQPPRPAATVADGLRTALSERTFRILKKHCAGVLLVSEDDILSAMRILWQRAKLIVEPSGAVSVAALLAHRKVFKGHRVGVIVSGGNVDLAGPNLAKWMKERNPSWRQ